MQDAQQILAEYAAFVSDADGWELLEQSEKGVLAIHHHVPTTSSVKIGILGLDAWKLTTLQREASVPHEPYLDMRIQTSEEAEDDGSLVASATQFVDFMARYAGSKYESQDLPRLHNEDEEVHPALAPAPARYLFGKGGPQTPGRKLVLGVEDACLYVVREREMLQLTSPAHTSHTCPCARARVANTASNFVGVSFFVGVGAGRR